ncbi:hypothetical protein HMN09_00942200 [Mycena chlorophos]|uniref:Uncharacterized protein n=1 Tax=Mycena chlorophos TaxID=658473 RepID=A0A8H6W0K0_MYCCL|nr:hypothetical protein HMN09_00942200 [Mycena chlorophos]
MSGSLTRSSSSSCIRFSFFPPLRLLRMVFRLPTHLDNFIPPPAAQARSSASGAMRPWRGTLTVRGMRSSDLASNQEIRVTAVETDGDSDAGRWPTHFFAHIVHGRPIQRQVRDWVQQHAPAIATFMPDRLPDPDSNTVNLATFRSLSRMLFEQQLIAIAPWGSESSFSAAGGGIVIIPAEHSSALLVAALFFSQIPDFITSDFTSFSSPSSAPSLGQHTLTPLVTTHPHTQHNPLAYNPYGAQPGPSSAGAGPGPSYPGAHHYPSPTAFRASRSRSPPEHAEQMISATSRYRPMNLPLLGDPTVGTPSPPHTHTHPGAGYNMPHQDPSMYPYGGYPPHSG